MLVSVRFLQTYGLQPLKKILLDPLLCFRFSETLSLHFSSLVLTSLSLDDKRAAVMLAVLESVGHKEDCPSGQLYDTSLGCSARLLVADVHRCAAASFKFVQGILAAAAYPVAAPRLTLRCCLACR